MSLENILGDIKKKFFNRKPVEFPDFGLRFEIEPISSAQELAVTEECKKFEGVDYMDALKRVTLSYAIKKVNDTDLSTPTLTLSDSSVVSTPVYLQKIISDWHGTLRDTLFVAYVDMYKNLEKRVSETALFERYVKPPVVTEDKEATPDANFKKIKDPEEELTEVEQIAKKVEQEIEQAQEQIDKDQQ